MPASHISSLVDLLAVIAAATWIAVTLATARRDSAPGLRSFGAAWAAVALYLLVRPGEQSGDPTLLILDLLAGAAAAALFLHGARAWAADPSLRRSRGVVALTTFGLSSAIQSTLALVAGPASEAMADFRTARLFVVMALSFIFTATARRGERISARIFSWAFGTLALLAALSFGLSHFVSLSASLAQLPTCIDSIALLAWVVLAAAMVGCVLEDRTHLRAAREQSESDEITGLVKRAPFEAQLQSMLAHARDRGQGAALMVLDLGRFQTLNDSMGHGAGDAVLLEIADRLRQSLPPGALAGRVGGDEFAWCSRDRHRGREHFSVRCE